MRCFAVTILCAISLVVAQFGRAAERTAPSATSPAPLSPRDAAGLALLDLARLPPEVAFQRRYLWCPNRSPEEHAAAALVINTAISRSNVDVKPQILFDGAIMAVDLEICAPDRRELEELIGLWAKLSTREPYFHVTEFEKFPADPYTATDGKTYDWRSEIHSTPAPHLGKAGIDLELLVGNPHPDRTSFAPILRIDQWLVRTLSTVDGGMYYDFRELAVGRSTLNAYLTDRGINAEQIKRIGADERAAFISEVTGKARAVTVMQGSGARPSVGQAIVAITDDPFDGNTSAAFDPFRELLDAKTNGHEVLLVLPSGWIEYTLWDAAGKLVAEAPPNLVADHRIPEPYTRRLQGAISCIRCHAPNDQWQPYINEVPLMLGDRLRVHGELSRLDDVSDTLRELAGRYAADHSEVLRTAQNNFSKRVFAVTGMEAKAVAAAVASLYNAYEYEPIDAAKAVKELGGKVANGDVNGVATFRQIVPPLDPHGRVQDDPIVGRFHVEYFNAARNEKVGLANTRRQWEKIFPDAMIRAIVAAEERQQIIEQQQQQQKNQKTQGKE